MGLLRFLLAIAVVLSHTGGVPSGLSLTGGAVAVQCFYIVSGFVITMVLQEKYVGRGSLKHFYVSRFRRVYVPYVLALSLYACSAAAAWLLLGKGTLANWVDAWPFLGWGDLAYLIFAQLTLLGQDILLFLGLSPSGLHWTGDYQLSDIRVYSLMLIVPAWSLSLELAFYVLAPFILRRPTWALAVLLLASLTARAAAAAAGYDADPWSYRFFPFELALFLGGALAYRLVDLMRKAPTHLRFVLAAMGPAAVLTYPFYGQADGVFFEPGRLSVLITVAISLPALFLTTGHLRTDRQIGDLSYPIYLIHMLVLSVAVVCGLRGWACAVVTLVGSIAFSVVMVVLENRAQGAPLRHFEPREPKPTY